MNSSQKEGNTNPSKIGQLLFIGMLVIQALFALFISFSSLISPQMAMETGFNIVYNSNIRILTVVIGMQVLFSAIIAILAIVWTRRKSIYGIYLGTAIGLYLTSFGIVAYFSMGQTSGLLVDTSRGILTLIFAYLANKELNKYIHNVSNWNTENIPDQKGKVILITGATSGLGKEATKVLVSKGAKVVMAVRNTKKAEQVVAEIKKVSPNAQIDIKQLDLGSLSSIKSFAKEFTQDYQQLDILINNAGIMMCPFSKTEDGFEIQMGTNHLGPFALTGLLMPLLSRTQNSRIVSTSSVAHNTGNIDFTDINWERRSYNTNKAYSDSKLANLYFSYELKRKLANIRNAPLVTTAHPGGTRTELARHSGIFSFLMNTLFMPVEKGVLSTLRAATDLSANSGDYYGPGGIMQLRGFPALVQSNAVSHNLANAKNLWDLSEQLTGINY